MSTRIITDSNGRKHITNEPLLHSPKVATLLAAQQDIQRLSALVRAQQITIDKLEAQRQWVGLTDAEIKGSDWVLSAVKKYEAYTLQEELVIEGVAEFAHAIEAKLKEKNNG
jgi:hypothetical protein